MLVYLKDVSSEALSPCLLLYLSMKVAPVMVVTPARSGGEPPAWVVTSPMQPVFLAEWRAGLVPSFSPGLALTHVGTGISTQQFPFPDLLIPEEFSVLGS